MINPINDAQSQELEKEEICKDILRNARNELYLNMRFLDTALSSLIFQRMDGFVPGGTDGRFLFYNVENLISLFCRDRESVNRFYLHTLLHCTFLHVFPEKQLEEEEQKLWNLACDITIEKIIDGLYLKCVHKPASAGKRRAELVICGEMKTLTAPKIYKRLKELKLSEAELLQYTREFYVDDHKKWYELPPNHPKNQMQRKNWEDIRNKMQTEMEIFSKEASKDSKSLKDQLKIENRNRHDYKEFLRKFSVLKEEMKVDMDTFDYIFYHYGMETYGNMPLIEPLETKEERKVEDFVIVIDTSMSCKGELVKKFLEETYSILSKTESFFRRIHIHLIQCDEKVQSDVEIEDYRQLKEYMEHFTVLGQGGTDFRPAFIYVDQLLAKKKFTKLRGLIYFTDGYGIFPVKKPPYETAFVFMKEDYTDLDVPPWAIKLILEEEDLGETEHYEY